MSGFAKRTIAVVLALCMLITLLSGCTESSKTVLKVNGEKIRRDDFMAHIFFAKYGLFAQNIEAGQTSLTNIYTLEDAVLNEELSSGITYRDYLKMISINSVAAAKLYRAEADKNKIKLSDEDKDEIESRKKDFIEMVGGGAAFNNFLKVNQTTENAVTRYMTDMYYGELLSEMFSEGKKFDLTEEEKAAALLNFDKNYVTVRHILLLTINTSTYAELSDEVKAQKLKKAEEALGKLRGGADFDAVHKEYSEVNEGQMTFTAEEMTKKFEEAAFDLKIGEISGIVKTEYGYHIIIRDELDKSKSSTALDNARYEKYRAYITKLVEEANIVEAKAMSEIVVD